MAITLRTQAALRAVQARAFCYLCARPLQPRETRNRDHVPPSALFATVDRQPALILPTHTSCNHSRSAEDELIGQLIGVLRGRPMAARGRRPKIASGTFPDGSLGLGVTGLAFKPIIFRWVTAFHAALYNEPLGPAGYMVFPPVAEGQVRGARVEPVAVPEVIPHFVQELRRNRGTGTLDVIACRNGRCRYECVWSRADDGRRICVWGLDLYGWKDLGDVEHFGTRGCVGAYWPNSGLIPSTATLGTLLDFAVPTVDPLDPFAG
jgi:hypothetical protein